MSDDKKQLVALYNFDPTKIDWPFKRQKPLPLVTGQTIKVMYDDGSDWLLGMLVSDPTQKGYFPKNYTVTLHEYYELMKEYADGSDDGASDDSGVLKPEPERLPAPSQPVDNFTEFMRREKGEVEDDEEDTDEEPPEETKDAIKKHPALSTQPPISTTLSDQKVKLLKDMPKFDDNQEASLDPIRPEIGGLAGSLAAIAEGAVLNTAKADQDATQRRLLEDGGRISDTRASTPATYTSIRPPRDFVRKHMDVDMQQTYLRRVTPLDELIKKKGLQDFHPQINRPVPYEADLRVRATTCRIAAGIEPPHMRIALEKARTAGARWTQMFRPGLNDMVNETVKMGADASILSNLYMYDYEAREQFMKQHIRDVKGVLWFELQRRKQHLFYMRMDFVDLMMFHPDAWGFPDALQQVSGGEATDPLHGWYAQRALDNDQEMEEAIFSYKVRQRKLPSHAFQALALGKMPEWVMEAGEITAEVQQIEDIDAILGEPGAADEATEEEEDRVSNATEPTPEVDLPDGMLPEERAAAEEAAAKRGSKKVKQPTKGQQLTTQQMLEAGLGDEEDVYLKVNDLKFVKQRTIGPDVLDVVMRSYKLKGTNAMRLMLRSRGSPDKTSSSLPVSPKQIKDLATQLGILGNYHFYWYCYFALRYPLPPHWDLIVKNDVRWYINLETEHIQPIHPMVDQFREHLSDCIQNDFLWDYRGFVKIKCSECGIPDSIVWCQQCTDYYCIMCFQKLHKSKRGRKHWVQPLPGCRYLTASEVQIMKDYVPMLNVGFTNRRRFLARDNQSDKTGYEGGDKWLYFTKDTFEQALAITPAKHWFLQRLNPPRLSSTSEGYYYNFKEEIVCDDPGHIIQKAKEQKALLSIQKFCRGALARAQVRRETAAVIVIQKYKRMWDCQKIFGKHGSNAIILRGWYRKFKAHQEKELMHKRASQIQALFRGKIVRISIQDRNLAATKLQSAFRGSVCRVHVKRFHKAADVLQRAFRMYLYGKKPVRVMNQAAARLQAMSRGTLTRMRHKNLVHHTTLAQARMRGYLGRKLMNHKQKMATKIQSHWRRWQAQLAMKMHLYSRLDEIYGVRKQVMKEKLSDLAATMIQRNFRKHKGYEYFVNEKRDKAEADKRISTVLVSALLGASNVRYFVHPWFRHLPPEIQEVLEQIKASLQRTLGLTRVTGKLANEEIGTRSKRCSAKDLTLDESENDLGTHMLVTIVHHLLSHIDNDVFSNTVKWCCYNLAHLSTSFLKCPAYPFEEITLGKQPDMPVPPRPGEPLESMSQDYCHINHHHDRMMTATPENFYVLFLANMPPHLRHVYLTAQILITTRQALDLSSLSTDDHFAFQGVDATVGSQIMDVLSKEMGLRYPSEWPKAHGTVYSLATQVGKFITTLPGLEADKDGKPSKLADPKQNPLLSRHASVVMGPEYKGGRLSFFNRPACLRIVQQLSYLMRDQEGIIRYIRRKKDAEKEKQDGGEGNVRQSRFIAVIDKLFDLAYKAKHDHCPFVLAVVLFHMLCRGLMVRTYYHRASVQLQSKYRYYKATTQRRKQLGPALLLQRYWRGVKTSMKTYNMLNAVELVQHNVRAVQRKRKNHSFTLAVAKIQRLWRGAVMRKWFRKMNHAAITIQKNVRRLLILVVFNKEGRRLAAKFKQESHALCEKAGRMTESEFLARKAALVAKSRVQLHKHRERNIDYRRMVAVHGQSKHARAKKKDNRENMKGTIQPVRLCFSEPLTFAIARGKRGMREQEMLAGKLAVGTGDSDQMPSGFTKTAIMTLTENAKRSLEKTMPPSTSHMKIHPLKRRGSQIKHVLRVGKRPQAPTVAESKLIDEDFLSNWETKQFRTSIPWIPKSVGLRLVQPHQKNNLRATYFMASAFLGGLLSRADDKRPAPWFHRLKLPKPQELPADVQEHMAAAAKIICTKINQDVTTLNTKNLSPWRKALMSVVMIWKSLFAYAGARTVKPAKATPVLLMSSNESMFTCVSFWLSRLWIETLNQFTTRENRYRGIKSRPKWDVLETLEYRCVGEKFGFAVNDPARDKVQPATASANSVKAANLQDFLEEVLALRFASEMLMESNRDAEEHMDHFMKRKEKAKKVRKVGADKNKAAAAVTGVDANRQALDSFTGSSWTEDAEVRSISKHISLLLGALEGTDAHLQGYTVVSQLVLACFRGLQPMFEANAIKAVNEINVRHIQQCQIPIPKPEHPDDGLNTHNFALMSQSYEKTDPEKAQQILNAAPTAILALVCKLQANFKGFMLRARYSHRVKVICGYCKEIDWPRALGDEPDEDEDELTALTRKANKKKDSGKTLDEKIATYQPVVSQYLGGQGLEAEKKQKELKRPGALSKQEQVGMPERGEKGAIPVETLQDLPQVRITADHRACADLYALYVYNMYRRREMAKIWKALSFAYDTVVRNFVSLLEKNASLKPMVESVSAQLKRGRAIGFSKAYVPKSEAAGAGGDATGAPGRIKPVETELFHRKPTAGSTSTSQAPGSRQSGVGLSAAAQRAGGQLDADDQDMSPTARRQASEAALEPERPESKSQEEEQQMERPPDPNAIQLSGDYLTRYLEETNGDDSQFKDIEPAVIPFSTGTSPRRERPDEYLFREDYMQKKAEEEMAAAGDDPAAQAAVATKLKQDAADKPYEKVPTPNVTVDWCKGKLKPMWLPIKAHRFTACRSKVLQLLPAKQLEQYIEHEKQCHYAACIKLLETCVPGNLNVFQPSQLVANRPLLIETIFQLLVGYIGLCLKNSDSAAAARLCLQTLEAMQTALRDLHPAHRAVLEAYLYDTALSVAYYSPQDVQLASKAESFFQQASQRYLKLKHVNRFAKCCLRYGSVLFLQNHHHEAEYFLQQALNKLTNSGVSSLLVVCYHNLAVETAVQDRLPDAGSHMRTYISLLRQMSKLSNQWIQKADNTQWLLLKLTDLWPAHQARLNAGMVS
ncbi:unnamed protein product [Amoebophrya sp. A120]|nr:unnamed protein product [Amoebophrya sp. A120]|eukprot:GSA120T00018287001.1